MGDTAAQNIIIICQWYIENLIYNIITLQFVYTCLCSTYISIEFLLDNNLEPRL